MVWHSVPTQDSGEPCTQVVDSLGFCCTRDNGLL
jgi:hypothetical protein